MEYVDDDQDIETSLKALDHIKDWAHGQLGEMRRKKPDDPPGQVDTPAEEAAESPATEALEQPMDQPAPRDYGNDTISVRPKMADMSAHSKPPPSDEPQKDNFDMSKWKNETIHKLDKYGKRRR